MKKFILYSKFCEYLASNKDNNTRLEINQILNQFLIISNNNKILKLYKFNVEQREYKCLKNNIYIN